MKEIFGPFVMVILLFSACDKSKEVGNVTILLNHKVGINEFVMHTMEYQTNTGHPFSITRLAYFLSDFTFHNTKGEDYHKELFHLFDDFQNSFWGENTEILPIENIPRGSYDKITFTFGLDEGKNIDGMLGNIVAYSSMSWPIPGESGYNYMKFEGQYDSLGTGIIKDFNIGLGATENNQNFFTVTLDLPNNLEIDENTWVVDLEMDLLEWFQNPTSYDFVDYGDMIMTNQNAQSIFRENGESVFNITGVNIK